MEVSDMVVIAALLALVVSDWSQIAYNRAATRLMLEHGKEIDMLREAIDANCTRGHAAESEG